MATTQSDYQQIEAARNKVSQLTQSAGDATAGVSTFRDDVMQKVLDARASRGITNLQTDFGNATQQLATGRQEIVDRNKGVVNPLTINQITNQQRGQALNTLSRISQYNTENTGTIENAIQAGANTLQSQAVKIKAQADAAQTELQNLMDVVKQKQLEAQTTLENTFREKQYTEGVRQFNASQNLEQQKLAASKTLQPKVYEDNEITRAAGLVGMPINAKNNDKVAYQQYLVNEQSKKASTAAQIKAAKDAGMIYDPATDTFKKDTRNFIQKWIDSR